MSNISIATKETAVLSMTDFDVELSGKTDEYNQGNLRKYIFYNIPLVSCYIKIYYRFTTIY